jgi:uncharacterized protein (DUF58 family)
VSIFREKKLLRAVLIVVTSILGWGIVGYLVGGWAQVLFFGAVIGGIFAAFGLFIAFWGDRQARRAPDK